MNVIKAPGRLPKTLFLAGSIEMGQAENWQESVTREFSDIPNLLILNPRRDDWDDSWVQSITNPQFKRQVEWEIAAQEAADVIFMYFAPDTRAPITLLELGLFARSGKLIVCCPDGYYRRGNIEIVCDRFRIPLFDELDRALKRLRQSLMMDSTETTIIADSV
jgi:hypothetical protein